MRSQHGEPVRPDPVVPGTEVLGTVTGVTSTRLIIKDLKSRKFSFSLDASTHNPDVAEIAKNAIVRVTYAAPYVENRLAQKVQLIEPSGGSSGSTKTVSRATKSGTILSRGPERLQILRPSGSIYTFYTGNAAVYGDTWAGAGDSATVSYYVDGSGAKIATKITYRALYGPIPEPWPVPVPVPVPNPVPVPIPEPVPIPAPVPIPPAP